MLFMFNLQFYYSIVVYLLANLLAVISKTLRLCNFQNTCSYLEDSLEDRFRTYVDLTDVVQRSIPSYRNLT